MQYRLNGLNMMLRTKSKHLMGFPKVLFEKPLQSSYPAINMFSH